VIALRPAGTVNVSGVLAVYVQVSVVAVVENWPPELQKLGLLACAPATHSNNQATEVAAETSPGRTDQCHPAPRRQRPTATSRA
jgi:hypothetical protein